jgi:hypothetical protein
MAYRPTSASVETFRAAIRLATDAERRYRQARAQHEAHPTVAGEHRMRRAHAAMLAARGRLRWLDNQSAPTLNPDPCDACTHPTTHGGPDGCVSGRSGWGSVCGCDAPYSVRLDTAPIGRHDCARAGEEQGAGVPTFCPSCY